MESSITNRRKWLIALLLLAATLGMLRLWSLSRDKAVVEIWAPRLVDQKSSIRQEALAKLRAVSPAAVAPALIALLDDELQTMRRWGAPPFLHGNYRTYATEFPELFVLLSEIQKSAWISPVKSALERGRRDTDHWKSAWSAWALKGLRPLSWMRGHPYIEIASSKSINSDDFDKLQHDDPLVRRWAAMDYYFHNRRHAELVEQGLNDQDPVVRLLTVAKCAIYISHENAPWIISALNDESDLVKAVALEALCAYAQQDRVEREDIPQLDALLHDADARVRRNARHLLGQLEPTSDEAPLLIELLEDCAAETNPSFEATTSGVDSGFVPNEYRTLSMRTYAMWSSALALGRIQPPPVEAIPVLQKLVADKNQLVSVAAAISLRKIRPDSAEALKALNEAVEIEPPPHSPTVALVAQHLFALPLSSADRAQLLDNLMQHEDDAVLLAVALSLAEHEPSSDHFQTAVDKLAANKKMRRGFVGKVDDWPASISGPILTAALADDDPEVRLNAARILSSSSPETPGLFDVLSELLTFPGTSKEAIRYREQSCFSIARIGGPRARKLLEKALDDPVAKVREAAKGNLQLLDQDERSQANAKE